MKAPELGYHVNCVPPAAIIDNAAITCAAIDTKGFKFARIRVVLGATDIAMAVAPKMTECDTSDGSYTDITGVALATAPSATDDNKMYVLDVPLEGRKRYLKLAGTCGDGSAGTYIMAIAELFGAEVDVLTAAGNNLGEWIN